MKLSETEELLILLKRYGVSHFKDESFEIAFGGLEVTPSVQAPQQPRKAPPPHAVPPTEMAIPHHVNEVANLLKLGDEDLVDKLFPDYSQLAPKE